MAKLQLPVLFSERFEVDDSTLTKLGVFNPTLNVDSLLFPDPLLLERSSHPEMNEARKTFETYFEQIMMLLHGIRNPRDKVWRTAFQLLSFPEIQGTCLGYGAGSIGGSGSGPGMAIRLLETGQDIVRMGIDDPDLFMAMGLFEKDFGPDLIGDMLTNIAFGKLLSFNERIVGELGLPTDDFDVRLRNGKRYQGRFVRNPTVTHRDVPVILVPLDILRALPIATDWSEVQQVAEENEEFRGSINDSVAALWSKKTLESKEKLKAWALSNQDAFGSLLDLLHGHDGKPYDFIGDPHGELIWRDVGKRVANRHPLSLTKPANYDQPAVLKVVNEILKQFQFLIEKRDLWRDLYASGKPRFEKAAQRMFYVIAYSYCMANDIDITPEADTGRGPVDFKLSTGLSSRVLVEIKLSTNNKVVQGYERQLKAYEDAELPIESHYLVLDVGSLTTKKIKQLTDLRDERVNAGERAPRLTIVDGTPKQSASNLKTLKLECVDSVSNFAALLTVQALQTAHRRGTALPPLEA